MESQPAYGLRRLILIADAGLLVLALALAARLHVVVRDHVPAVRELATSDQLLVLPLVVIPVFLLFIAVFGLNDPSGGRWRGRELLVRLLQVHGAVFLLVAVLLFITQTVVNRSLAALYLGCSFALLGLERMLLARLRAYAHWKAGGRKRLLLVGRTSGPLDALLEASSAAELPPEIVGVLAPPSSSERELPFPRLGQPEALPDVLHQRAVDEVVFLPPFHRPEDAEPLLEACELVGVPASFWVEVPSSAHAAPRVVFRFGQPLLMFERAPRSDEALALKRAIDFAGAALALLVLSPLMLLATLLILVTMGRPIFFVQERAGLFGRTFRMRKFRTMRLQAEAERESLAAQNELSGPVFKMTRDPRVTGLGRLLRKTSVDELPQLLHVLSGTMSLVGPRPLPVKEQALIRGWHRRRLSMKPGITGLWQVSGRSDLDFETWMKLDLQYVDTWSLWQDVKILLRTVPTVLFARGAK